jgi:hypothetical protein
MVNNLSYKVEYIESIRKRNRLWWYVLVIILAIITGVCIYIYAIPHDDDEEEVRLAVLEAQRHFYHPLATLFHTIQVQDVDVITRDIHYLPGATIPSLPLDDVIWTMDETSILTHDMSYIHGHHIILHQMNGRVRLFPMDTNERIHEWSLVRSIVPVSPKAFLIHYSDGTVVEDTILTQKILEPLKNIYSLSRWEMDSSWVLVSRQGAQRTYHMYHVWNGTESTVTLTSALNVRVFTMGMLYLTLQKEDTWESDTYQWVHGKWIPVGSFAHSGPIEAVGVDEMGLPLLLQHNGYLSVVDQLFMYFPGEPIEHISGPFPMGEQKWFIASRSNQLLLYVVEANQIVEERVITLSEPILFLDTAIKPYEEWILFRQTATKLTLQHIAKPV